MGPAFAAEALVQVPAALFMALLFILQLAFAFFFIAFQFIGLFWLLSRGGVDVYFPGDVKSRFTDVWAKMRYSTASRRTSSS